MRVAHVYDASGPEKQGPGGPGRHGEFVSRCPERVALWEARVATTHDRDDVIDLSRTETGGDDISVVPGGNGSGSRGRGTWIWIAVAVVVVAAVIVGLVAALSSGSDAKGTVKTTAQAPVATQPVTKTSTPTKHASDTTVAPSTPTTAVTRTTTAPTKTHTPAPPTPPAPPGNNTPPPTAPPQPLGPSALTWNAPTTFSISKNGDTLTVTVANNTHAPAYTPLALNCLAYGDHVCGEHTQTLQAGEHVTEHYTLDASQFTSTPTAVYVGGYFKVMISA